MRAVLNDHKYTFMNIIAAIVIAAGILSVTIPVSRAVLGSRLYRQSKFATYIFSHESTGLTDIVKAPERVDVFIKFLGAVTAAYINFEMIPVNEANTFVTIFESLNDSVEIESFSYHGKSLSVTGTSDGRSEYFRFYEALSEKEYFDSITGRQYVTNDDKIRFELECAIGENRVFLFAP